MKVRIFNTLSPRQHYRHFADDIFKCMFLNENVWISLGISLKFVPKVRMNNFPTLVQIMAWRRPGAKSYLNQWWWVYWRIYASLVLNGLMSKFNLLDYCSVIFPDFDECSNDTAICMHNGTCTNFMGGFNCTCTENYMGETCESCK